MQYGSKINERHSRAEKEVIVGFFLLLLSDNIIIYAGIYRRKTIELLSEYRKVGGYKINIQINCISILAANNWTWKFFLSYYSSIEVCNT